MHTASAGAGPPGRAPHRRSGERSAGPIRPDRRVAASGLLLAAALLLAAGGAGAADPTLRLELLVSRISDGPGGIDPDGRKVHDRLRQEFRYQSLEVIRSRTLRLSLNEVGGLELPSGKRVRVRPLLVDERGALLAVEVEGSVKADLRVKPDQLVIIGTERQDEGKLVISMEATF